MRPIGFSTGALAKGDFEKGIELQMAVEEITAIELSALREHELETLVEAIAHLELSEFDYVSFHAPSKLKHLEEREVVDLLLSIPDSWPIIAHPEILTTRELWVELGPRLCIENMDNRKSGGRTFDELASLFELLPAAKFCLDVGHARQIDPTMATALLMLTHFGDRLTEVHVSDVGPLGEHGSVGALASVAFNRIAAHLPETCPLIIESMVPATHIRQELMSVIEAFELDDSAFDKPLPYWEMYKQRSDENQR